LNYAFRVIYFCKIINQFLILQGCELNTTLFVELREHIQKTHGIDCRYSGERMFDRLGSIYMRGVLESCFPDDRDGNVTTGLSELLPTQGGL
jgi:hypothetical protein